MQRQLSCLPGIVLSLMTLPGQGSKSTATTWVDSSKLRVEGKAWEDTLAPFDRLPEKAAKQVRTPVWKLSRNSAGILLRFKTNAASIYARWTLTSSKMALPHMPATGVSGLDLYVHHKKRWRWLGAGRPTKFPDNQALLVAGLPKAMREYLLYLPLYNGVKKVSIGVPTGAKVGPGRAPKNPLPLVFYGTSITQGGCASRPGMVHTAILGRQLDREVINLGFSGNGTMDASIGDLLTEVKAAAFIIDCLPNMRSPAILERLPGLVRTLRKAHPRTPILLVEDRSYADSFLVPSKADRNKTNRAALRKGLSALRQAGFRQLHLLEGSKLLGDDGEATVDSSHPTDLGFVRQAAAFREALAPLLRR